MIMLVLESKQSLEHRLERFHLNTCGACLSKHTFPGFSKHTCSGLPRHTFSGLSKSELSSLSKHKGLGLSTSWRDSSSLLHFVFS